MGNTHWGLGEGQQRGQSRMIMSRSLTFPREDGPEGDGPDSVVGFLQADVMLFKGIGDEEQLVCDPEGAGVGDTCDDEVAGVLERMDSLNIRYAWVATLAADLPTWANAMPPRRALPAVSLPCVGGRAPFIARACWPGTSDLPDPEWLRTEVSEGRVKGLGELVPELIGIAPDDPRLEPYWQLAEEFDIPVAIHMGSAPPAAAYESSPSPFKFPAYRVAATNPLLLEDVLLRQKRLRLLVMHAGWPFLDATVALMYAHRTYR